MAATLVEDAAEAAQEEDGHRLCACIQTFARRQACAAFGARQRTAFNVLAKALDVAVRDGVIDANPLHRVARPTAPQAIVPAADPQLVDDVLLPALAGWDLGPLVYFVAMTGCRVGEALGITWDDVDLTARTATLRRSGHGTDSTKGGHARAVPLLPELADVLVEHRRQQRELRLASGQVGRIRDWCSPARWERRSIPRTVEVVFEPSSLNWTCPPSGRSTHSGTVWPPDSCGATCHSRWFRRCWGTPASG